LQGFGDTYALHFPRPLDHPYFWAYQYLMVAASRDVRDSRYSGRCEIVFDEQVIFAPHVKKWYPVIRRCVEDEIRAIIPSEPLIDLHFERDQHEGRADEPRKPGPIGPPYPMSAMPSVKPAIPRKVAVLGLGCCLGLGSSLT